MFTTKERSALRSLAQNIDPITQIGKGGIGENLVSLVSSALDAHELVKLSVLKTADGEPDEIAEELAEKLGAEVVCVVGRKIVLYRFSNRKNVKHINFRG